MAPPNVNNPLIVPVNVTDYNNAEGKSAKVKDANKNGVVDPGDTFARGVNPAQALDTMCRNRAPANTKFAVTSDVSDAGITVTRETNANGIVSENLNLPAGIVPSYGAYLPELNACAYNEGISVVDMGPKKNEILLTVKDYRGTVDTKMNINTFEFSEEIKP